MSDHEEWAQAQRKLLIEAWPRLSGSLSTIRDDEDLEARQALLDLFLDEVKGDEGHPHAELLNLLGLVVEDYEEQNFDESRSDPASVLAVLIKDNGLQTTDLVSELGSLENVIAILRGELDLTRTQILALSRRFNVSPALFF